MSQQGPKVDAPVARRQSCLIPLQLMLPSRPKKSVNRRMSQVELAAAHATLVHEAVRDDDDTHDLSRMPILSDETITNILETRYNQQLIYTRLGAKLLLAINPFQPLPQLYSSHQRQQYADNSKAGMPHIFQTAATAYEGMSRAIRGTAVAFASQEASLEKLQWSTRADEADHTILVSGESGAGKTESAKRVIQFLTQTSCTEHENDVFAEKILGCNPLLEAFGNAKTSKNNNSSRFGKYIELLFSKSAKLIGVSIKTYLLEKSRVVAQPGEETNFHILEWLGSPLLPSVLKRSGIDTELYISQDKVNSTLYLSRNIDTQRESRAGCMTEFEGIIQCMCKLEMSAQEISSVLECTAAVIHLGCIKFIDDEQGEYAVVVQDQFGTISALDALSKLLDADADDIENILTLKTIKVAGEAITTKLTKPQANAARDAFARTIHGVLFEWVLSKVNGAVAASQAPLAYGRIGILDIFGFEDMDINSLEQILINYANEALQGYFNETMFQEEKSLYSEEGIEIEIEFASNLDCLALIEGSGGIFATLHDQCKLGNRGSDSNFFARLCESRRKLDADNPEARFSLGPLGGAKHTFAVVHYAGTVEYETTGFVSKNRDEVPEELAEFFSSKTTAFLATAYEIHEETFGGNDASVSRKLNEIKGPSTQVEGGKPRRRRSSLLRRNRFKNTSSDAPKVKTTTLCIQFRNNLRELVARLRQTIPHFVRCVKPNDSHIADMFEASRVSFQLRCAGVFHAIDTARVNFPIRLPHAAFVRRFRLLLMRQSSSKEELAYGALTKSGLTEAIRVITKCKYEEQIKIGKSLVFLKSEAYEYFERELEHYLDATARRIQNWYRSVCLRRHMERLKLLSLNIQRLARGYLARRRLKRLHTMATVAQRAGRAYLARKKVARRRAENFSAIAIQGLARGFLSRCRVAREERPQMPGSQSWTEEERPETPDSPSWTTVIVGPFHESRSGCHDGNLSAEGDVETPRTSPPRPAKQSVSRFGGTASRLFGVVTRSESEGNVVPFRAGKASSGIKEPETRHVQLSLCHPDLGVRIAATSGRYVPRIVETPRYLRTSLRNGDTIVSLDDDTFKKSQSAIECKKFIKGHFEIDLTVLRAMTEKESPMARDRAAPFWTDSIDTVGEDEHPDENEDGLSMWVMHRMPYLGCRLGHVSGRLAVFALDPGSHAYRAGLREDDVFIKIKGQDVSSLTAYETKQILQRALCVRIEVRRTRMRCDEILVDPHTNSQHQSTSVDPRTNS